VIDVGTNSVKLLVADVGETTVRPVTECSHQTRLGAGFYETRQLQPRALEETAATVHRFHQQARETGAVSVRQIATSAAREANNRETLQTTIRELTGTPLEILSGDQEAELGFLGVRTQADHQAGPLWLADLGGGSTQLVWGRGARPEWRMSYPIGTVRLLERLRPSNPPTAHDRQACQACLDDLSRDLLLPSLPEAVQADPPPPLVITGGTATLLARMQLQLDNFDRDRLEQLILTAQDIRQWRDRLWSLSLDERRRLPGLPANRADVILMGAAVCALIMRVLRAPALRVSTRGLRFGALRQIQSPPRSLA
jgi:exopolyphosphatase/guanosine-5'-triphosphate,3'-diphosphate pyrophosphatase